jgi:hypothetical protein
MVTNHHTTFGILFSHEFEKLWRHEFRLATNRCAGRSQIGRRFLCFLGLSLPLVSKGFRTWPTYELSIPSLVHKPYKNQCLRIYLSLAHVVLAIRMALKGGLSLGEYDKSLTIFFQLFDDALCGLFVTVFVDEHNGFSARALSIVFHDLREPRICERSKRIDGIEPHRYQEADTMSRDSNTRGPG